MKLRSLLLGLLVTSITALPQFLSFSPVQLADATEPAPATPGVAPIIVTNIVNAAEVAELRAKVESLQQEKAESNERWSAITTQNTALSNVLTGLQQSLETQRKREIELGEEARSFNTKVMFGAGAAIFLVFLASYWFQLRCLNRVMEITREMPQLPAPGYAPNMLEAAQVRESKLLDAVRILENRIRHLESPGAPNGSADENGHLEFVESEADEPAAVGSPNSPEAPVASKVSVLLAKGDVLLETERLQEALTTFTEAVNYEPTNVEAHLKKGIALERLNKLEQALGCYNDAVRLNPKRSFAYVHKARVLAALQRYDEALSVYDMALGKPAKSNGAEEPVRMFKDAAV